MVTQYYDTDVNKEYVIRGNPAVLKCQIPSFVADFVEVISWHTDQDETFDATEKKFGQIRDCRLAINIVVGPPSNPPLDPDSI